MSACEIWMVLACTYKSSAIDFRGGRQVVPLWDDTRMVKELKNQKSTRAPWLRHVAKESVRDQRKQSTEGQKRRVREDDWRD